MSLSLGGWPVIVSPLLPRPSSPAEDAKRIVRHGLADVLTWLGEPIGPKPGKPTRIVVGVDPASDSAVLLVDQAMADELARRYH